MSKQGKLTAEDMAFLGTIEKNLRTAVEARWVSHMAGSSVDRMLEIWKRLTGQPRPHSRGCNTCILHLTIDLGTLYFQQKAAENEAEAAVVGKHTARAKKSASGKNNKQK